jgi:predicted membrane-bound spermidine synthase
MPEKQDSLHVRDFKMCAPRSLYFVIFAVSGFSGLIYESIWSHYLKLFLGHAAYAQSLVLIIFMGGMALGSWFASRYSARSKSPLLLYAGVELIVGLAALLFHDIFTSLIEVFYAAILPSMGSPTSGAILKWLAASVLIMPQSILLGMTFPLMSAGIIRRFPDTPGGSIAMLYFTNSIGAAIGVLASGFWLIKLVGLPGTIFSAGLLNIVLAVIVWVLIRLDPSPETAPIEVASGADKKSSLRQLFLVAAFVTGAASFIYEISWIRMLSLVLGATTHSFELMLSAFITGLAFGGLWIKRRIDRIGSPVRFSGYVQLIMGILALLTIPVYITSFYWMEWLLQALESTDAGFTSYSFASHAIALSVMLPTTFMAGMTLPLFTYVLIRQGQGEGSIGQIYAANTIGAIVGVLVAVHIGLPMLGLKGLIVVGAMLDIGLGLILLSRDPVRRTRSIDMTTGAFVGLGALVLTITLSHLDPLLLMSGVYRNGSTGHAEGDKIIFYQDGKTASVSLLASSNGLVVLSTNGKPDASIQFDPSQPYSTDEITMAIAGSLPLAYMPDAKQVANIGMGSGLTTHVMLAHEGIEKIDTIEIESAMVAAATGYGDFVERAYTDPRSEIHIEDAKTFFSLHNNTYDIIIAEPSNPWVSGVASLFSTEFYHTIKRYLHEDGLFVQWIQLYEFSDQLAESILKALSENFSDYVIYTTDGSNILLIAKNEGELRSPDWSALFASGMAGELAKLDVKTESDMLIRKIIERDSLVPYLKRSQTPTNSDYFPFVDLNAGKARYKGSESTMFGSWMIPQLPVAEMLTDDRIEHSVLTTGVPFLLRVKEHENALWIYRRLAENASVTELGSSGKYMRPDMMYVTDLLRDAMQSCVLDEDLPRFRFSLHDIMSATLPFLDAGQGVTLVDAIAHVDCAAPKEAVTLSWLDLYRAVARRDAAMMSTASRNLLADDAKTPQILYDYLVVAAMLGDISAGSPDRALAVWDQYSEKAYADRRLLGHVELISRIALDSGTRTPDFANAGPPQVNEIN